MCVFGGGAASNRGGSAQVLQTTQDMYIYTDDM